MAKISIDLKTNYGEVPEEKRILFPSQAQAEQAFSSALIALRILGDISGLVEVIKIDFSQLTPEEVIKDEGFPEFSSSSVAVADIEDYHTLRISFTAILSEFVNNDRNKKLEIRLKERPSFEVERFSTEYMSYSLAYEINKALERHVEEKKEKNEALGKKLELSRKNVIAHAPMQPGYGDD